ITCTYTALGANPACSYSKLWNADDFGFDVDPIDGLFVGTPPTMPNQADARAGAFVGVDDTIEFAGDDVDEVEQPDSGDDEEEEALAPRVFLPLLMR
ncbi:MAG: hypothetical protein M3Q45_01855, partial [Chloroflexota bacterium]|nr:hypothetical protein [Chloroflexota bacterium]